jgi:hypothetical protein
MHDKELLGTPAQDFSFFRIPSWMHVSFSDHGM